MMYRIVTIAAGAVAFAIAVVMHSPVHPAGCRQIKLAAHRPTLASYGGGAGEVSEDRAQAEWLDCASAYAHLP